MKTKKNLFAVILVVGVSALPVATTGCSSSSKKTTTTTTYDSAPASDLTAPHEKTVTQTEESSSSSKSSCSGILGCTVHTLGVVIAYPFHVVGSLFEAIF